MSYTANDLEPPLGVGRVLSQSFSILFRRFVLFFLLAFAVQVVALLLTRALMPTPDVSDPANFGALSSLGGVLAILLSLVATSITTGIIVVAAYDTWLGNPSRPGAYVGAALAAVVPLVVLSLVTNIGIIVGLALLIVPGLYLNAMWACVTPAIVAEGAGFSALGRSAELTKNYRWSIVGLLVILFAIVIGSSLLFQSVVGSALGIDIFAPTPEQMEVVNGWTYGLANAVVGAVTTAFMAIVAAVLYARLKEIKEGVGYEDLGSVFD